ncbi:hypothetical protein D3C80_2184710 [compost metagenome]
MQYPRKRFAGKPKVRREGFYRQAKRWQNIFAQGFARMWRIVQSHEQLSELGVRT